MNSKIVPSSRGVAAMRIEMKTHGLERKEKLNPLCRLPKCVAAWTEELTLGVRKTLIVLGFNFSRTPSCPTIPFPWMDQHGT